MRSNLKRVLLAGVAASVVIATASSPAYALFGVGDIVFDPTNNAEAIIQTAHMVEQLIQLKQEVEQTLHIITDLESGVNPLGMATNLLGIVNPMPQVGSIASMIQGNASFGSVSGLASSFLQSNTYYMPPNAGREDFNAMMLNRQSNTLAGLQAMSQQSLSSLEEHMDGLNEIRSQLDGATTQADLTAIQARLQAESSFLTAQGVQAQSIRNIADGQQRAYEQMQAQRDRESADALLKSAMDSGGGAALPTGTPVALTSGVPTFIASER